MAGGSANVEGDRDTQAGVPAIFQYSLRIGDNGFEWEPREGSMELILALQYHFPEEKDLASRMQKAMLRYISAQRNGSLATTAASATSKSPATPLRPADNESQFPSRPVPENQLQFAGHLGESEGFGIHPGFGDSIPPAWGQSANGLQQPHLQNHNMALRTDNTPTKEFVFDQYDPSGKGTPKNPRRTKEKYDKEKTNRVIKNRGNVCDMHRKRKMECNPDTCPGNKLYIKREQAKEAHSLHKEDKSSEEEASSHQETTHYPEDLSRKIATQSEHSAGTEHTGHHPLKRRPIATHRPHGHRGDSTEHHQAASPLNERNNHQTPGISPNPAHILSDPLPTSSKPTLNQPPPPAMMPVFVTSPDMNFAQGPLLGDPTLTMSPDSPGYAFESMPMPADDAYYNYNYNDQHMGIVNASNPEALSHIGSGHFYQGEPASWGPFESTYGMDPYSWQVPPNLVDESHSEKSFASGVSGSGMSASEISRRKILSQIFLRSTKPMNFALRSSDRSLTLDEKGEKEDKDAAKARRRLTDGGTPMGPATFFEEQAFRPKRKDVPNSTQGLSLPESPVNLSGADTPKTTSGMATPKRSDSKTTPPVVDDSKNLDLMTVQGIKSGTLSMVTSTAAYFQKGYDAINVEELADKLKLSKIG